MASVIPPPKCPKCGKEMARDWDTEGNDWYICRKFRDGTGCGFKGPSSTKEGFEFGFLAGLEAAREAIRPISDEEELSPIAEAQWERLRVLIEAAKKEVEGNSAGGQPVS